MVRLREVEHRWIRERARKQSQRQSVGNACWRHCSETVLVTNADERGCVRSLYMYVLRPWATSSFPAFLRCILKYGITQKVKGFSKMEDNSCLAKDAKTYPRA